MLDRPYQKITKLTGAVPYTISKVKKAMAKGEVKKLQSTLDGLMELLRYQGTTGPEALFLRFGEVYYALEYGFAGVIRELQAEIRTDFAEGETIVLPSAYLESILKNLLGNALKYRSPDRKPQVWVSTTMLPGHVLLRVRDNGVGIDPEKHRDQLFKPFERFHASTEGTGLGLHMISNIVQRNGGHIEVESQPGLGTTFSVYLREYPLPGA
ncbi:sensor histidine kinase [Rufibacter tibetensis]|uniref:sensor histidine kinase n=1 Tax=Rufibacter tibetensis TaxID=512763 RepID=UPI000782159F|nr:HAMP domain-containing sensor histidine kinase [Rufibacter tibetensis]